MILRNPTNLIRKMKTRRKKRNKRVMMLLPKKHLKLPQMIKRKMIRRRREVSPKEIILKMTMSKELMIKRMKMIILREKRPKQMHLKLMVCKMKWTNYLFFYKMIFFSDQGKDKTSETISYDSDDENTMCSCPCCCCICSCIKSISKIHIMAKRRRRESKLPSNKRRGARRMESWESIDLTT